MIFSAPGVTAADKRVLGRIEQRRTELRFYLHRPRRWYGTLRRVTEARAIQGSNSIACRGWRLRRPLYVKTVASSGEEITAASATRDLAAMVNAGLLVPSGERRGRTYRGTSVLRSLWQEIRDVRLVDAAEDPYRST